MTVIARGCSDCNPQTEPRVHKLDDRHWSIDLPYEPGSVPPWQVAVLHNGEPILDCSEVFIGPGGFARRIAGPKAHKCPCGSGEPEWVIDEDDQYTVELPT